MDQYRQLEREAQVISATPGLSAAAAADLKQLYHPIRYLEIVALQVDKQSALSRLDNSPYGRLERALTKHGEAAEKQGLHRFATPGWPKLAEQARNAIRAGELTYKQPRNAIRAGELTYNQDEKITGILVQYNRWAEARRAVSNKHDQDQSQGISF
ncbi:MAG: hypothetical protein OXP07_15830 [Defluviicoccus sp.]|nr:hypothetical protein [Defluviicoccus sp.]